MLGDNENLLCPWLGHLVDQVRFSFTGARAATSYWTARASGLPHVRISLGGVARVCSAPRFCCSACWGEAGLCLTQGDSRRRGRAPKLRGICSLLLFLCIAVAVRKHLQCIIVAVYCCCSACIVIADGHLCFAALDSTCIGAIKALNADVRTAAAEQTLWMALRELQVDEAQLRRQTMHLEVCLACRPE